MTPVCTLAAAAAKAISVLFPHPTDPSTATDDWLHKMRCKVSADCASSALFSSLLCVSCAAKQDSNAAAVSVSVSGLIEVGTVLVAVDVVIDAAKFGKAAFRMLWKRDVSCILWHEYTHKCVDESRCVRLQSLPLLAYTEICDRYSDDEVL